MECHPQDHFHSWCMVSLPPKLICRAHWHGSYFSIFSLLSFVVPLRFSTSMLLLGAFWRQLISRMVRQSPACLVEMSPWLSLHLVESASRVLVIPMVPQCWLLMWRHVMLWFMFWGMYWFQAQRLLPRQVHWRVHWINMDKSPLVHHNKLPWTWSGLWGQSVCVMCRISFWE